MNPTPTTAPIGPPDRLRPGAPALIALVTLRINTPDYRLAASTVDLVMRAIAGVHPVESVVPDELPDTDDWTDTAVLACKFRPTAVRRDIVRTVVAAWRAVAQDLAATAAHAGTLVDDVRDIAAEVAGV